MSEDVKTWRCVKYLWHPQRCEFLENFGTGDELMTEIEAVHLASVLNERDRGRGVKWVAVEAGK